MRRRGLLVLLLIAALGAGAAWIDSQISRPYRGRRPARVFVDIPHGISRWRIAGELRRDDVIRNRFAFALFSEWHFRKRMQAGEYLFDQPLDSRQVFWKIEKGQIYVHTVTVPEGWTMYDIAAEMASQGLCSQQEFLAAARDTSAIADLAPHARSLEGFLFPSTYRFSRHTSCQEAALTMVRQFRTVWQRLNATPSSRRESAGKPSDDSPAGMTAEQIITVASLVERETPKPAERPLVAGVFYNRLKRGYPLQCDPTVQYAMELTAGHSEGKIHAEDLGVNSAYNTYEHRGLPPGPIANPGEASLAAALQPAHTDYLYFVANGHGGHFFSRTLAEQDRNIARYRRLLLSAGGASGARPDADPPAKMTAVHPAAQGKASRTAHRKTMRRSLAKRRGTSLRTAASHSGGQP